MRGVTMSSLLVASAAALSSCGCPEPTASVDTSADDPAFSWFGGDAYQLIVSGPDGVYWSIQCSTGQNCIPSPTRYGLAPDDAIDVVAARELDRGTYEVLVCPLCGDTPRCGPAGVFEIE